jgi:hypothetical protein
VELRLSRARLQAGPRTRSFAGRLVRLVVFWIAPVVLVLGLAYVVAGRS